MNSKLDVSLVMEYSWGVFKKHWVILSLFILVMMVVSGGVALFNPHQVPQDVQPEDLINWYVDHGVAYYAWTLLAAAAQAVVVAWVYKEILQRIKGKEITFNSNVILRYIGVSLIVAIATYVALLCCIIPVFFIAPRLIIAPLYIIDNPEMGVGEAIERSWKDTKDNVMSLLALGFIALIISMLGLCLCFVGIIPASALNYILLVVIYLFLSGQIGDSNISMKEEEEEEYFEIEEKTVCR